MTTLSIQLPAHFQNRKWNEGFSLEENGLMLEIGSTAVLAMKKEMFGMKEEDKERIKEEFKKEIGELTMKNMILKTEYLEQYERQKEEIERKNQDIQNTRIEIEKEKLNCRLELQEQIKQKEEEFHKLKIEVEKEKLAIHQEMERKMREEIERRKGDIEKEVIQSLDKKLQYNELIQNEYKEKSVKLEKQLSVKEEECQKMKRELEDLREKEIQHNREEREKTTKMMKELTEKLEKKNVVKQGLDGEKEFYNLALTTFRDFKDFEIKNTSKTPCMGDFHLVFEHFVVMVDCKKYSNGVSSVNREKLKRDITSNKHIKIAWMVSLDSSNDKYGKYPFMIDNIDIQNGYCICYVNSLLLQPNPEELLKMVWYTSELLYLNVLGQENNDELTGLKNKQKQMMEIAKQLSEITKNQLASISQFEENCQKTNVLIKQLLTAEITKFRTNDFEYVKEWWNKTAEKKIGNTLKSSHIHSVFKTQNPEYRITEDAFKLILQSVIEPENIVKQKMPSSPLKINGYVLKEISTIEI